jgi:MoaA/NifB/PqqE/SkfB family radical SAM enzyme
MQNAKKMLSIHTTDLCNNRCIFCIVDSPCQTKQQVSREKIDAFLEENRDSGYVAVNLHGGETTTRRDVLDLLEKIQECGYSEIILQTNARKLSDIDFARKVIERGVCLVVVSMHGKDSATHDSITRVSGSFEQAMQGIRNVKTLGASVRTNTVVSKMNQGQIQEIASLLINEGVDHINISALHTAGTAYRNFDQVTPRYRDVESEVVATAVMVDKAKVQITLEGFPYCCIRGAENYVIEWENEQFKMLFRSFVYDDYSEMMDRMHRVHGTPCMKCERKSICGGVYKEYAAKIGWSEIGYNYGINMPRVEDVNAIAR